MTSGDVGLGPARGEASVGSPLREAEKTGEPVDHALLQLGGGGALVPAVHAVVEAGYDQLRADGLGQRGGVEVGHVVHRPGAQEVREDDVLGVLQHRLEPPSVLWEEPEAADLLPQVVGVNPRERAPVGEGAEYGGEGLAYHLFEPLLDVLGLGEEQRFSCGTSHLSSSPLSRKSSSPCRCPHRRR